MKGIIMNVTEPSVFDNARTELIASRRRIRNFRIVSAVAAVGLIAAAVVLNKLETEEETKN
jgi:hypothetical protein